MGCFKEGSSKVGETSGCLRMVEQGKRLKSVSQGEWMHQEKRQHISNTSSV